MLLDFGSHVDRTGTVQVGGFDPQAVQQYYVENGGHTKFDQPVMKTGTQGAEFASRKLSICPAPIWATKPMFANQIRPIEIRAGD